MSLVTRCPRCKTLFRVLPAQLQARAGQVRCGRCMHAFDGFQALAVEQANVVSDPVRFEAEHAAESAAPPVDAAKASAAAPMEATVAPGATVAPATPLTESPAGSETPTVPTTPLSTRVRGFWSSRIRAPLAERLERKLSVATKWAAACTLLGLLLFMQMAYAFRSDLVARYPSLRSWVANVCDVTGCSVSLPQRPTLVRIEASDVHMINANRPSLIQLTATLRSYANYDLAYPALDLVLTNANEHALARRVFVPEEYLDQTRDPKAGIPPRGEVTVALDLDTGDLNAAGFRLDLLAAPAP